MSDAAPGRPTRLTVRGPLAVAVVLAALAAGAGTGWWARGRRDSRPEAGEGEPPVIRIHEQGATPWRFVNPLLECDVVGRALSRPELVSFKDRLLALVDARRKSGELLFASVYFRELNEGPWTGVNERIGYIPASLLKLPTLIAVLKRAEGNPGLLELPVPYPGGRDLNATIVFRPPETLVPGESYTVEELLRRMVRYSDNNATSLLNSLVTLPEQEGVLRGLGVDPAAIESRGKLTVKAVSAFLRVLYNATYLDHESSEKALEMLSQAWFRDGIIAGVPPGTRVCSKYGEAAVGPGLVQLHEFAIVYHERRPYLLGVMTQGRDFGALARFLRDVSATVHEEVERQSRPPAGEAVTRSAGS